MSKLEGMLMDVVVLARIQFAANITFHILFPSSSIALGWVLLFSRLRHLRATDPQQKLDWLRPTGCGPRYSP
jgi:cytochrome d ubiquinol oxidase subunit I